MVGLEELERLERLMRGEVRLEELTLREFNELRRIFGYLEAIFNSRLTGNYNQYKIKKGWEQGGTFYRLAEKYHTIPEALSYTIMFGRGVYPNLDYEGNTHIVALYDEWVRNDKADNYIFVIPSSLYTALLGMFEKEDKK